MVDKSLLDPILIINYEELEESVQIELSQNPELNIAKEQLRRIPEEQMKDYVYGVYYNGRYH